MLWRTTTLNRILKLLKPIGEVLPIPVWRGPLKGFRLLAIAPIRFFKGTYESERTNLFLKLVKPGDIVYDIGAHMGYFTLIAAKQVGTEGCVIAFEPHPTNLRILRKHLRLNNITNVMVIEAAVAETSGKANFAFGTGTGTGHLAPDGQLEVRTVCLDELVQQGTIPPPQVIKVDVEGAELQVIKGALQTIAAHRPIIFLEAHSRALLEACDELLTTHGFVRRNLRLKPGPCGEVVYMPNELQTFS